MLVPDPDPAWNGINRQSVVVVDSSSSAEMRKLNWTGMGKKKEYGENPLD